MPSIHGFIPGPELCEEMARLGAEILADDTFKYWYRVHATRMWGATRDIIEHEREWGPSPTKMEAAAAGRAHVSATMMAVWAEAVPVTRAERAESTFFAWEAIMEAARTFEEDVEEAARTFEAEQATTIEV